MSTDSKSATSTGAPREVPVSELSYSDASRELDEIVAFFEHQQVDVDQLVTRLERAAAIVEELDRRICGTRLQVEQLVPRLRAATEDDEGLGDGGLDEEGLEEGDDAAGGGQGAAPQDEFEF